MILSGIPAFTTSMTVVLCIFIVTYILLLVFSDYRAYIAAAAALVYVALGIANVIPMTPLDALTSIEWNVILMILGTMGVVGLFIESKMPALLAEKIIEKSPDVRIAVIGLTVFAGLISAFVDNVATVLMVVPIALVVCKKLKINPVPVVIAIAVASNLEGAATLVGDTTSILLGQYAGMNFFDFFFYEGNISLFWVNQIGLIAATLVLFFIFRKQREKIIITEKTKVTDYLPTVLMISVVVLLITASFLPANMTHPLINGFICVGLMLIGLVWKMIKKKKLSAAVDVFKSIDFLTLLLLAGIFIIVEALVKVGIITWIGEALTAVSGGNVFLAYTMIVWISVFLSAFIDNIPYVAMMLPVVTLIASNLGVNPTLFYFGLLSGATLGGNLTPIGASANITAIGILRKEGHKVKTWDFMRIGIPYTLVAVTVAYILIWFIWK